MRESASERQESASDKPKSVCIYATFSGGAEVAHMQAQKIEHRVNPRLYGHEKLVTLCGDILLSSEMMLVGANPLSISVATPPSTPWG